MQQDKLQQAIAAFDHWRQSRTKRSHTPNELRQLAVELVNDYSHNYIATTLRINARQLKIWCDNSSVNVTASSDFMSLPIEHDFEPKTEHHLSLEMTLPNSSQIRLSGALPLHLLKTLLQEAGTLP